MKQHKLLVGYRNKISFGLHSWGDIFDSENHIIYHRLNSKLYLHQQYCKFFSHIIENRSDEIDPYDKRPLTLSGYIELNAALGHL